MSEFPSGDARPCPIPARIRVSLAATRSPLCGSACCKVLAPQGAATRPPRAEVPGTPKHKPPPSLESSPAAQSCPSGPFPSSRIALPLTLIAKRDIPNVSYSFAEAQESEVLEMLIELFLSANKDLSCQY